MRGCSCPNFESYSLNMSTISECLLPTNCQGRRRLSSDGQMQTAKKTSHRPKLRVLEHSTRSSLHGANRKAIPTLTFNDPASECVCSYETAKSKYLLFFFVVASPRPCHEGCRLVMSFIPLLRSPC